MGFTTGIFAESLVKYFNRSVATAMEFTVALFVHSVVDCYGDIEESLKKIICAFVVATHCGDICS